MAASPIGPHWYLDGNSIPPHCFLNASSESEAHQRRIKEEPRTFRGEMTVHPRFTYSPPQLPEDTATFLDHRART